MSTPAGWYDDGSGRQRWWDGQQWTQNFAPEQAETPGSPPPTGPSLVGWIALGTSVLGFIAACIPPIIIVGWVLLFAAFVLSIVAFFLRGKKWAPIVSICVTVVGAVVAGIVALVLFTTALVTSIDQIESAATPVPSESADDSLGGTGTRPTADEVAEGLATIVGAQGVGGYDDEIMLCLSEEMVANTDMSDETLTTIAQGGSDFADGTVAMEFTSGLSEAITVCAPELQ